MPENRKANDYQNIAAGLAAGNELRLRVDGNSMMPLIRAGDVVVVRPAPWDQLACGDIVAIRRPAGDIVSHRIITTSDTSIVTKGDNMRAPDPAWRPDDVLGRVVAIERGDTTIDLQPVWQQTAGWILSRLSRLEMYMFRGGRWLRRRTAGAKLMSWSTPVAAVLQLPFRLVRRVIQYVTGYGDGGAPPSP